MLKKRFFLLILSSLLVCILVACGAGASSASITSNPNASGTEVHMKSTSFVQTAITIQKGESITLIDDDAFIPHIIANGTWENGTAKPAREPNAPAVNNVQINGNGRATIGPFTAAGTFKFYCTIHSGMNLTIIVL